MEVFRCHHNGGKRGVTVLAWGCSFILSCRHWEGAYMEKGRDKVDCRIVIRIIGSACWMYVWTRKWMYDIYMYNISFRFFFLIVLIYTIIFFSSQMIEVWDGEPRVFKSEEIAWTVWGDSLSIEWLNHGSLAQLNVPKAFTGMGLGTSWDFHRISGATLTCNAASIIWEKL